MSVELIVAIVIGSLVLIGTVYVISDVRAYKRRKQEYTSRSVTREGVREEQRVA